MLGLRLLFRIKFRLHVSVMVVVMFSDRGWDRVRVTFMSRDNFSVRVRVSVRIKGRGRYSCYYDSKPIT